MMMATPPSSDLAVDILLRAAQMCKREKAVDVIGAALRTCRTVARELEMPYNRSRALLVVTGGRSAGNAFRLACLDGDTETAEHLISHHGARERDVHAHGEKALRLASAGGATAVVEMLCGRYGADPNRAELSSIVLVDNACRLRDEAFRSTGTYRRQRRYPPTSAAIAARERTSLVAAFRACPAVCVAAICDRADIVEMLCSRFGGDVHVRDDLALRCAAQLGNRRSVEALVRLRADVHVFEEDPLRHAARYGHVAVVELLCEHGADTNACAGDALYSAAEHGHVAIVDLLCARYGADARIHDDVAARIAARNGHSAVVDLLRVRFGAQRLQ